MTFMEQIKQWLTGLMGGAATKALTFVVIAAVGMGIIRMVMAVVDKALEKSKLEKAAHSLIRSLVKTVLYVLLGLIAASSLGIDVTGVIALASVLSLAVSLAVQDLLANVIGGFTLLYTQPFHSGDMVEIAAESGTVVEIGMAYTKLRTGDNKEISIPNKAVVAADIVNYSITGRRRVDITVSASYDAPTDTVLTALYEAAQVPGALEDPAPFAAIDSYGDHAIAYVLRVWSDTQDYWDVYYAVNAKVRQTFAAHSIEMTYPHLNVHLQK